MALAELSGRVSVDFSVSDTGDLSLGRTLLYPGADVAIGSAFVPSSGFIYVWLPGLLCLLALAQLFWHRLPPRSAYDNVLLSAHQRITP